MVDVNATPSGTGCRDCLEGDGPGWWFHLRRCADCGNIGCCDSSLMRHASAHFRATGHRVVRSFEPGEEWFYDFVTDDMYASGPELAPPRSHPLDQPTPGPADAVPEDWQRQLQARQ